MVQENVAKQAADKSKCRLPLTFQPLQYSTNTICYLSYFAYDLYIYTYYNVFDLGCGVSTWSVTLYGCIVYNCYVLICYMLYVVYRVEYIHICHDLMNILYFTHYVYNVVNLQKVYVTLVHSHKEGCTRMRACSSQRPRMGHNTGENSAS